MTNAPAESLPTIRPRKVFQTSSVFSIFDNRTLALLLMIASLVALAGVYGWAANNMRLACTVVLLLFSVHNAADSRSQSRSSAMASTGTSRPVDANSSPGIIANRPGRFAGIS
ncbi:hypothetical protein D3C81_1965810 [compost metagenome]